MTRLEAIRAIRRGDRLEKDFSAKLYGIERDIEVWIRKEDTCNFSKRRRHEHKTIGPIHLRLWAVGNPHWLHITPKQLLGFIRRNYSRK